MNRAEQERAVQVQHEEQIRGTHQDQAMGNQRRDSPWQKAMPSLQKFEAQGLDQGDEEGWNDYRAINTIQQQQTASTLYKT